MNAWIDVAWYARIKVPAGSLDPAQEAAALYAAIMDAIERQQIEALPNKSGIGQGRFYVRWRAIEVWYTQHWSNSKMSHTVPNGTYWDTLSAST